MSTAQRSPLAQVYNEMHGLLVRVGKHYCLKQQPKCEICPLGSMLPISIEDNGASRKIRSRSPG
jgi:endonuclease III